MNTLIELTNTLELYNLTQATEYDNMSEDLNEFTMDNPEQHIIDTVLVGGELHYVDQWGEARPAAEYE